jgi:hypothetical protein
MEGGIDSFSHHGSQVTKTMLVCSWELKPAQLYKGRFTETCAKATRRAL